MKKILVFNLIIFLLCGCSQPKNVAPILNNISFIAQIDYDEHSYTCDVILADDSLKLTLIEPEEIRDLIFLVDKSGLSAEFKGVSFKSDIENIPQSVPAHVMFDVLDDVINKTSEYDSENCELTGKIKNYKYTFLYSPSGLPILLTVNDLNLKIKFNNVTLN